jgi:hypothetical protein
MLAHAAKFSAMLTSGVEIIEEGWPSGAQQSPSLRLGIERHRAPFAVFHRCTSAMPPIHAGCKKFLHFLPPAASLPTGDDLNQ